MANPRLLALILLTACKPQSSAPPPAPDAAVAARVDPCTKVRQYSGHDDLVCPVALIDDALAAVLGARPDRDEVQLLFASTNPQELASVAKVPWVRGVLIYPAKDAGGPPADLRKLEPLRQLRKLSVRNTFVREVEDAWAFPELRELHATEAGTVDLSGAAALRELIDLSVGPVTDLRPISGLVALEQLDLPGKQTQLKALSSLSRLTSLSLEVTKATDLAPLAGLSSLKELVITGASFPELAAAVEKLPALTRLFLNGEQQPADTRPLARLTRLQLLDFGDLPITDITPLQALPSLKELMLWNAKVKDLKVLLNFPALARVLLPKDTPEALRAELKAQRPDWF